MANGRFQVNHIDCIVHNNLELNNEANLNNLFTSHFKQIFGKCIIQRADLFWQELYTNQSWNSKIIERLFFKDEIKLAVFSLKVIS